MENIHLAFSHFDNQQRRQKTLAGQREALMKGRWIGREPTGYHTRIINGKKEWLINKDGKLLRKAFYKIAADRLSCEEVRQWLAANGLALYKQKLHWILNNPFYCGVMVHAALGDQVVEGEHPPIISKDLFRQVQEVLKGNSHGYKIKVKNNNAPLKRFVHCEQCGEKMTGYLVKAKDLWYYKCRTKGCCDNKSAKKLHELFRQELKRFALSENAVAPVEYELNAVFYEINASRFDEAEGLQAQLKEIERKIDRLEERFLFEEISEAQYRKFVGKLNAEREEIERHLGIATRKISNLESFVEKAIKICRNLGVLWENGDFDDRQMLQDLVFPEGIYYSKKNDRVRTSRVNSIFVLTAQISRNIAPQKAKPGSKSASRSNWVGPAGLEPATT
ncbi:MAG: recombinase family protein [Bacteroidota bacterium]